MQQCWHLDQNERPSASDLVTSLTPDMENSSDSLEHLSTPLVGKLNSESPRCVEYLIQVYIEVL